MASLCPLENSSYYFIPGDRAAAGQILLLDESIIIPGRSIELVKNWQGDHIEVVVLAIDGNSVKLGIDCPKDLDVWRYEIWRAERRAVKR